MSTEKDRERHDHALIITWDLTGALKLETPHEGRIPKGCIVIGRDSDVLPAIEPQQSNPRRADDPKETD